MSFLASSYPEGLCKKSAFENFTEKNVCAGSFFNKDSGRGSVTLLETLHYWCLFVNSANFLKTVNDCFKINIF